MRQLGFSNRPASDAQNLFLNFSLRHVAGIE